MSDKRLERTSTIVTVARENTANGVEALFNALIEAASHVTDANSAKLLERIDATNERLTAVENAVLAVAQEVEVVRHDIGGVATELASVAQDVYGIKEQLLVLIDRLEAHTDARPTTE